MLKVFFEGRRARDRLREKPDDSAARRTYAVFLLAQARGLSETGESKQADALIRHAIQLDPQYRPAREAMVKQIIEKGDFSLRAEDYPEALKRYRSALQWMPDSIPAHLRIAAALQRIRGKREESLAAYNRARELLQAKPRQGSPRERAGWSREIEEGLTRVDVRNPVYRARAARREIDKAESATRQGRLGETVEAYKRALQWTPEDGILHATLADTLRYVEDGWKDAIRHYGLAIRYLEKNPPAGMNPKELKRRIRHAERERAGLEKSHTGTIAYIRSKVLLAVRERRVEALLFLLVYGAALVLLWRSKPANGND